MEKGKFVGETETPFFGPFPPPGKAPRISDRLFFCNHEPCLPPPPKYQCFSAQVHPHPLGRRTTGRARFGAAGAAAHGAGAPVAVYVDQFLPRPIRRRCSKTSSGHPSSSVPQEFCYMYMLYVHVIYVITMVGTNHSSVLYITFSGFYSRDFDGAPQHLLWLPEHPCHGEGFFCLTQLFITFSSMGNTEEDMAVGCGEAVSHRKRARATRCRSTGPAM